LEIQNKQAARKLSALCENGGARGGLFFFSAKLSAGQKKRNE